MNSSRGSLRAISEALTLGTISRTTNPHHRRVISNCLFCSVDSRFQQLFSAFARIALPEYGAACDQDLSPGLYYACNCILIYAAVHFDTEIQATRLTDLRQQCNFLKGRGDEALAAKARIHAHDEDMVNQGENLI